MLGLPAEIAFLADHGVPPVQLQEAARLAERTGVSPSRQVIASGLVAEEQFYRALAAELGLRFLPRPPPLQPGGDIAAILREGLAVTRVRPDSPVRFAAAPPPGPALRRFLAAGARARGDIVVLPPSALLFNAVKFAGVAYLLYLAWQALKSDGALSVSADRQADSFWRTARRGALINILNPKLSIFFLALLPPFLSGNPATATLEMVTLGAIFMAMTFAVFVLYGLFAAQARDWLLSRNPGYGLAATGDWRRFPTRQPIFYRTDRLRLLDQGWFYYDAPEVVAQDRRRPGFWIYYASWADFAGPEGQRFRVYNVHFHFLDAAKRRHAARRLAAHVRPAMEKGLPVIVLGDMNALSGWRTVRILREAGVQTHDPRDSSFHFNRGLHILPAIDRLGRAPGVRLVGGPWGLHGKRAGDWPSDHYPVVADIALP